MCDLYYLHIFLPSLFQDINKRLSLPADIRLPEGYLEKFAMNSPPFDKPMSRRLRRASLVSNYCVCVYICVCVYVCKAADTGFSQLLWQCVARHLASACVFLWVQLGVRCSFDAALLWNKSHVNFQRHCALVKWLTKAIISSRTQTYTHLKHALSYAIELTMAQ